MTRGTSVSHLHFVVLTRCSQVLCLSVSDLRRYWGYLLQDCVEKHHLEKSPQLGDAMRH